MTGSGVTSGSRGGTLSRVSVGVGAVVGDTAGADNVWVGVRVGVTVCVARMAPAVDRARRVAAAPKAVEVRATARPAVDVPAAACTAWRRAALV